MKKINSNNSGFTLIELIIAIAVLAFLMTAVGTLMGSSVLSHKKSQAEISVHTSAQTAYNQVSDSIMQAKEIVLVGYSVSTPYDFSKPGATQTTVPQLVFYVKNKNMKDYIIANPDMFGTAGATNANVKLFSEFGSDTFYVQKLVVLSAEPIDKAYATVEAENTLQIRLVNGFTSSGGSIQTDIIKKLGTGSDGKQLYEINDTLISTFTFEENNMYYEKKYCYMSLLDDVMNPANADSKKSRLYNDGFSYIVADDGATGIPVTACTATVDAKNGAIGLEFQFNDLNMTYTTNGMVNIRNSYVLKGKDD